MFNPGLFQSDRDVISQFCVRERELGIILDVLRGNIESESCQHALLAAPHGLGKSMLLARTAAELRENREFSERLLPVRFMNECHGIADFADFWLETMLHLAGELELGDPETARELLETVSGMSAGTDESVTRNEAFARVCETASRIDRQLVLLVEDLEEICADAGEAFSRQLGDVLQSEPRIMLVATASGSFELPDDDRQAFAGMFALLELMPLGTDECQILWQSLNDDPALERNVRPLEILTDGNPRLLAMIAARSRQNPASSLLEEVIALADERTEYFRGQLESLPRGERRVLAAILDLWRASTTGEIAARARMDVRAVSTMLKRLIDRGMIMQESPANGGRRRYAAAEPLHCIWHRWRRGGAAAEEATRLVHFMSEFYGGGGKGMRLSTEVWETGLALLEADRVPREALQVVGDIRRQLGEKPAL